MPDEFEKVATKMYAHIKNDLSECNTAECRRVREEAEKAYNKIVVDGDREAMKELKGLRGDIGKLLEEIEKARSAPAEIEACPNCGYDKPDKPKNIGRCPDGCTKYNAYDKKQGWKHCAVCGNEIEWTGDEDEEE